MPHAAPHPCNHAGCPALTRGRFCPTHQRAADAARNARRPGAARSDVPRQAKERDGYTCQDCGRTPHIDPTTGDLVDRVEAHHIIPVARGGAHTLDNFITLCTSCHAARHDFEDPKWAAADSATAGRPAGSAAAGRAEPARGGSNLSSIARPQTHGHPNSHDRGKGFS
jgi:5-methylcytosine-specific restriction protein A